MISVKSNGDLSKTIKYLNKSKSFNPASILDKYGREGVEALRLNTPMDSGLTAQSWKYKIENKNGKAIITWYNTNVIDGVPIAILLQYGHGTQNGGWIEGIDYINPSLKPIFNRIKDQIWKEVVKS